MNFGSTFSGIGGFELGLEASGMICVWQSEIDPAASKQLQSHWPNIPNHGDIKSVSSKRSKPIDLLCGGFPCQDLSIAGKRKGLDGERSGLFFEFVRLAEEFRPAWIILENVPGLLSSNEGRDFAIVLRRLGELGYGLAWRILDAQYFGVPQRRRRVYIVGHLAERKRPVGKKGIQNDGRVSGLAAEVLFEREGVSWDPPARGEEGERPASPITASPPSRRNGGSDPTPGTMIVEQNNVASTPDMISLRANPAQPAILAFNADQDGDDAIEGISPTLTHKGDGKKAHSAYGKIGIYQFSSGGGDDMKDTAQTLRAGAEHNYQILGPTAFTIQSNDGGDHKRKDRPDGGLYVNEADKALTVGSTDLTAIVQPEIASTVSSKWAKGTGGPAGDEVQNLVFDARGNGDGEIVPNLTGDYANRVTDYTPIMNVGAGVRRLTPIECERLQGFPDDWTAGQSDSARYRQLGNAVAVPVVAWIGRRIMEVEARSAEAKQGS